MTEWTTGARAAIALLQADGAPFSKERAFKLVDHIVALGTISRQEMLAYGSKNFVMIVLGDVTLAVHGGGRVPRCGGWYRIRPGQPYVVDPAFAAAWIRARAMAK